MPSHMASPPSGFSQEATQGSPAPAKQSQLQMGRPQKWDADQCSQRRVTYVRAGQNYFTGHYIFLTHSQWEINEGNHSFHLIQSLKPKSSCSFWLSIVSHPFSATILCSCCSTWLLKNQTYWGLTYIEWKSTHFKFDVFWQIYTIMWAPLQWRESISITPKCSLLPLRSQPPPTSSSWREMIWFLCLQFWLFRKSYKWNHMGCFWLLLLSVTLLRFIPGVARIRNLFLCAPE